MQSADPRLSGTPGSVAKPFCLREVVVADAGVVGVNGNVGGGGGVVVVLNVRGLVPARLMMSVMLILLVLLLLLFLLLRFCRGFSFCSFPIYRSAGTESIVARPRSTSWCAIPYCWCSLCRGAMVEQCRQATEYFMVSIQYCWCSLCRGAMVEQCRQAMEYFLV